VAGAGEVVLADTIGGDAGKWWHGSSSGCRSWGSVGGHFHDTRHTGSPTPGRRSRRGRPCSTRRSEARRPPVRTARNGKRGDRGRPLSPRPRARRRASTSRP
jgi:hypothetical protein